MPCLAFRSAPEAAATGNMQVVTLLILTFILQSLSVGLNLINIKASTWRSKNTHKDV